MKNPTKRKLHILGWIVCLVIFWTSIATAQLKPKDLPEKYRNWLQEEVVYIITHGKRGFFTIDKR